MNIFWFRRDLRLNDNAGLYQALNSGKPVLPIFIFDTDILGHLNSKNDARVTFIYDTIASIKLDLQTVGSDLKVFVGRPLDIWSYINDNFQIEDVYSNHDYESYSLARDENIKSLLSLQNISFHTFKDHVIFEKNEITKDDGKPYTVFTPYKKKWLSKLLDQISFATESEYFKSFPSEELLNNCFKVNTPEPMINLGDIGFDRSSIQIPSTIVSQSIIKAYDENRNFPAIDGTSRLGIHFRFGTISIRAKALAASQLNDTYLSELIWRDFYSQILYHFPHVQKSAFRPEYDQILWRNDESEFNSWCKGQTGYPIVDAGMRELLHTGHMHNRVRMIVASFLTKHLLIDWRWGEAWFADKLLDFDLASNNGGWQWAAGCGTDAAPYFRIFSPDAQTERFDKDRKYVKKWIPEYGTASYPSPIVDHRMARERCLLVYKTGLNKVN
jgi:deoxyribodipyrimidine photo-lyase